jgi:ATP-dependent helicase YprA (DUF1998 family)
MGLLKQITEVGKPNKLPEDVAQMNEVTLADHIITRSIDLFIDQPKKLQVDAVTSLVQGKHTFVRAGTGFGKTRISEMFFGLFDRRVVVLVLVPLDSLGDDQVRRLAGSRILTIELTFVDVCTGTRCGRRSWLT